MNRTDRLFAITILLQTQKRVRAQDLARVFEVSERTIYRDMAALSESGVPIVSLPGEGYELVEGFTLPPVQFTSGEARAIFLSTGMLAAHSQGSLSRDIHSARAKIAYLLPEEIRAEGEQLAKALEFFAVQTRIDIDDPRLAQLIEAVRVRRVVWLRYHSQKRDEQTEREVEPEKLTYANGSWYLNGYCRLRQGPRAFRLSRVLALEVRAETFTPRLVYPTPDRQVLVRVRFTSQAARWARERQHYAFIAEEPGDSQSDVVMVYRVNDPAELASWVLGWGAAAEVLEPTGLREQILQEAQTLIQLLT